MENDEYSCPTCFFSYHEKDGQISCKTLKPDAVATEIHKVCVMCIRGMAKAALTDAPLAPGGVGLPCVEPGCENAFLMNDFYFYLHPDVYKPLMRRMQSESVASANLDNVVSCPACSTMITADIDVWFYQCPSCERKQCRHCPRPYDELHYEKTCAEVKEEESKNASLQKVATKLSEVVVRACPKCHLQFVKEVGCNKMACRCGTLQCYLCRQIVRDYSHFCGCGPTYFDRPCPKCFKTCPLRGDAKQFDELKMAEVRKHNIV